MSRRRRLPVTGYSHYILQQGHNNETVFKDERDYRRYLGIASALKNDYDLELHGWCLLEKEAHLLVCPLTSEDSISSFMQNLGGVYTRRFNARHRRSGTLWEGRYHCSVVEPGQWRLECLRYLDLLAVIRGYSTSACRYPRSSYRARIGKTDGARVDPAEDYLALGVDEKERRDFYRQFLAAGCDERERAFIETTVRRDQLIGGPDFAAEIERLTGRLILNRGPGRPPKRRR